MSKGTERIFAEVTLNFHDLLNIPYDRKEEIVNNQLTRELTHVIKEHIKELPISVEKENVIEPNGKSERYRLQVNLISDEELLRLRQIEENYNRILFNACEAIK